MLEDLRLQHGPSSPWIGNQLESREDIVLGSIGDRAVELSGEPVDAIGEELLFGGSKLCGRVCSHR